MWFLVAWLVFGAAHGLRRGRDGTRAAARQWTAKAAPGLFNTASVPFDLPGGRKITFDCRTSGTASIAEDGGLEVLEGTDGVAFLTAVQQKSGLIAGSIVDPKTDMVHQFSGEAGGELRFTSTHSTDFPDEAHPRLDSDVEAALAEKVGSFGNGTMPNTIAEMKIDEGMID